jgi:dynein heavy chain
MQNYMWNIFQDTIEAGTDKIRNNSSMKEPIQTDNLQLVKSICNFLQALLKPELGFKGDEKQKRKDLDSIFAWSFAWGMGASLDEKSKDFFDSLVKELFKTASFPPALTVYDYYYDLRKEKSWKEWQTRVDKFEYNREMSYFDMMVPTADTYKHRYCLDTLLGIGKNVFFTGLTGVGKSATIANALSI